MGLLDNLMGRLGGAGGAMDLLRDNPQLAAAAKSLLGSDRSVGSGGGLQDVLAALRGSGLDDIVNSWLGSGENAAISSTQVRDALGADTLSAFAARAGVDTGQASELLSQLLPQLTDRLSPQGELPAIDSVERLLGGLFGRGR